MFSYDSRREGPDWYVGQLRSANLPYRSGLLFFLEIYVLYDYNVTRYEPETLENGLFAGYVDTLLK